MTSSYDKDFQNFTGTSIATPSPQISLGRCFRPRSLSSPSAPRGSCWNECGVRKRNIASLRTQELRTRNAGRCHARGGKRSPWMGWRGCGGGIEDVVGPGPSLLGVAGGVGMGMRKRKKGAGACGLRSRMAARYTLAHLLQRHARKRGGCRRWGLYLLPQGTRFSERYTSYVPAGRDNSPFTLRGLRKVPLFHDVIWASERLRKRKPPRVGFCEVPSSKDG